MTAVELDALSPLKRALVEIRELKSRLAAAGPRNREPIAIVGTGLRLPGGATDADSYWAILRDGVDAITEVPADRWPIDDFYDPDPEVPGRMSTKRGGFVDGVDRFDAPFFGISPREAECIDPQQRLLLEVAWEALEDADIPPDSLFGSNAGVFIGIANSDYMRLLLADPDEIDTYTITGNLLSVAAGRLSYVLGARGPSIALDTACSSSLVAVHLAVRALRDRECDLALAGGVNLILSPEMTINFSRAGMMAPDGRCKTFDAAADGYVRSEGCAIVTLKRLADAEHDGDRVLAIIRGTAVNQDGRSGGLTAPNGPSQEDVVSTALGDAGVAPSDVSYVEAHGTGTLLGDPIEMGALGAVLGQGRPPDRPLLVGSAKTNIGHTESAAGVAGLIKAALMLHHGEIAPHLHLTELNPHIAARELAIDVPRQRRSWPVDEGARIAGVSSFGLSGTNAHVVLADAPSIAAADDISESGAPNVFTLSARSPAALTEAARRAAARVREQPDVPLADWARTANLGRSHLSHRIAVVASGIESLSRQLDEIVEQQSSTTAITAASTNLAFLFTGHGAQYPTMGRQLYETEPTFAAAIDRCSETLRVALGRTLHEVLFADRLDGMTYAQPAMFSLQFALTELWASWGVRPALVAGHSAGEYVAAVLAGVLDLDDALLLIASRGRLMDTVGSDGQMVALFVDEKSVAAAVDRHADQVGIAAVNGPFTTVVSGHRDAVDAVITELELDDDDVRVLPVSVAAHSPLVEPILDEFTDIVAGITLRRPKVGLVSSLTGGFVDDEITDPGYWRRHLRREVRFADVFATLRADGCSTFVEIGPDATLLNLGRRNWPDDTGTWISSMAPDVDEQTHIIEGVAALHVAGVDIDWAAFAAHDGRRPTRRRGASLPTYPWQRERHWSSNARSSRRLSTAPAWSAAIDAARQQATQGPLDLDAASYPSRWALLDRLAAAFIGGALARLGLFASPGATHRVDDLFGPGRMQDVYEHLGARWLDHLVESGTLARDGDRFTSPSPLPTGPPPELIAEARDTCDGIEPLLEYILRCGDHLAAVVSGRESALETLFPDGSYHTVDFLYGSWAVQRYFNGIVAAAVTAAATSQGGGLRVLEIGAGTGGTTAAILPCLPAAGVSYMFTDVSDFFLARAAERFSDHRFVTYARLDIEQSPVEQGHPLGSYDVIVAANVLHATRNLDTTLAHVRSMLAPGGLLIAFESTRHPDWFDMTTGLIEGWQRFDDPWRTDVPLIDAARWSEALLASGFSEVDALPGESAAVDLLQHVLLARASDDATATVPVAAGFAVGIDDQFGPVRSPSAEAVDVIALLADALPTERHDIIVDAVRDSIARVLRIGEPARLQRDQPLLELGFDSLMAVELRNDLRLSFALEQKLPATLVFDHPTINAISRRLGEMLEQSQTTADSANDVFTTGLRESSVAEMSDDEAEAALLARLTELET